MKIEYKESKKAIGTSIKRVIVDGKMVGVVGTVKDLLEADLLTYCEFDKNLYCFLSKYTKHGFGKTMEQAFESSQIDQYTLKFFNL